MRPEDLLNQTKLYQFLVKSKSRNVIKFDKVPHLHKKGVDELIKMLKDWMSRHDKGEFK